jgi:basic membrane protein A
MNRSIVRSLCTLAVATVAFAAPRVGLVTDVGGIDDKSFNQGTWEGIKAYAAENKLAAGKDFKFLQSSAEADYVPNLSTFADEKFDLIVAPGFLFNSAMSEVATQYPAQKFLIIDSVVKDKADHKDKVGFVGGMKFPLIEKFQAGFEQGVKAVNPACQVLVDYAGVFTDPGKGQALAAKQYGAGAYVVFTAAGNTGNGVIKEAKERTLKGDVRWAIGVDKDQFNDGIYAPGKSAVLTSMMKRVDVAAHDIADMVRDGKFPGGQVYAFSLQNKGVGLPASNPNLSPDILKVVAGYEKKIAAGQLKVAEVPAK